MIKIKQKEVQLFLITDNSGYISILLLLICWQTTKYKKQAYAKANSNRLHYSYTP